LPLCRPRKRIQGYAGPTIFVAIFNLLRVVDRHTGTLMADTSLEYPRVRR
jgi:hypothetical protein